MAKSKKSPKILVAVFGGRKHAKDVAHYNRMLKRIEREAKKARAAQKRKKSSKKRDWSGHPILHRRAALKGHGRDWPGQPIRHKKAAKKGWARRGRDMSHMRPTTVRFVRLGR